MKEDLENLISQTEAASERGVTVAAISDLIKRGRLQAVEIGGRKYLRKSDVAKFKKSPGGRPTHKPSSGAESPSESKRKAKKGKKK